MKKPVLNILTVGVGGQGVLVASEILAEVLLKGFSDIKVSAVHGMARRGASVVCQLRAGEKVHSPIIPRGKADILCAFDLKEALYWVEHCRKQALILTLDKISGNLQAKNSTLTQLKKYNSGAIIFSHNMLADRLKDSKFSNIFLLGALSRYFPFSHATWHKAIKMKLPRNTKKNIIAFSNGRRGKFDLSENYK